MGNLNGKRIFITGASRGIGKAIALRAARDGAHVAVAAKTAEPHPKLAGTVYSACEEIEAAGGEAVPCIVDIRDESAVEAGVAKAAQAMGGIDIVVNNASAIFLAPTEMTPMKRWDLMHGVNARGTYMVTQKCVPHLRKGHNPHILTISPPLNLDPRWFANHVAYTIAKYGMSLCVLGWAAEFATAGIAANALWPRTAIDTAAVRNLLGGEEMARQSRTPQIMADAAHAVLCRDAATCTGNFFVDDAVLTEEGVTDFSKYAVDPTAELLGDFFL